MGVGGCPFTSTTQCAPPRHKISQVPPVRIYRLRSLQARLAAENWRVDYSDVRPHSSLFNRTPSEFIKDLDLLN